MAECRGIVVVGASAGGVSALKTLVAGLPSDLPAAIVVVLHLSPNAPSRLAGILARAGPLPAATAEDDAPLQPGRIFVAPPDRHLVVHDGRCLLGLGAREHRVRPAIDPLFRSAADDFGERTVAVILTGARADGVVGCVAVSEQGGTVIVQDPEEAEFGQMPASAIALDHPDDVLPLEQIPDRIAAAVAALPPARSIRQNGKREMSVETRYALLDPAPLQSGPSGVPSGLSCPACGGVLWKVPGEPGRQFRCRVGHAYSDETALDDQSAAVERALFTALRALSERATWAESIAARNREQSRDRVAERFDSVAQEAREQAEVIRSVLLRHDVAA